MTASAARSALSSSHLNAPIRNRDFVNLARVHVVDQPEAEQRLQEAAPEHRLLVRMHDGVSMLDEQPDRPKEHQHVEHDLLAGRADGNGL
jgi:hypothetical protein